MTNVEAQALAYAMEIGAVEISEVQAWADENILKLANPNEEILMLSTENKIPSIVSLLHLLGTDADTQLVGQVVYDHLLKALKKDRISHERAAQAIIRLAQNSSSPSEEAENASSYFDDAFYLASEGISGSHSIVVAELEEHLRMYGSSNFT
jgi:hypothetical protein